MAIILKVLNADNFINSFRELIRYRKIKTWIVDAEGDFTHSNPQWFLKSWFRAKKTGEKTVVFGIIISKYHIMTKELYGVYHGRMTATLLANLDEEIQEIEITPDFDPDNDIFPVNHD